MKKEFIKEMSITVLKSILEQDSKGVEPMAMLMSKSHGAVMMVFEDLDNKARTAMDIITTAAVLEDVKAIMLVTESWQVVIDDPKIMKRFNGDFTKIQNWVRTQWPSLEDCPFRKEMIMVMLDDGTNQYCITELMVRDDNKALVWPTFTADMWQEQPDTKVNFTVTFNDLMRKSNILKGMIECADQIPSEFRPNPERIVEMSLGSLMKKTGYEENASEITGRCVALAESIKQRTQDNLSNMSEATRH